MFLKSSVPLKQEIKCDKIIDFIRILYTVAWTYDSKHTNEEFFKHFNNCRNKRLRLKIINEIKKQRKRNENFQ